MTIDNNLLGEFTLAGIPPAPRGVEKLDVTFDIDANGILNVTAINQSTGRQSAITITNNVGRLSQNDINRMINEAKFYKQEDDKKLERIAAKNSLEDYLYKLKKEAIKIDCEKILNEIDKVCKWLDANTLAEKDEFEYQLKKLESNPIIAKLYQPAGGFSDDDGSGSAGSGDDVKSGPIIEEVD